MPSKPNKEKKTIDIRPLSEAQTPQMLTESILSQLATAIGGYAIGRTTGFRILGGRGEVKKLKDALDNLKDTIASLRSNK